MILTSLKLRIGTKWVANICFFISLLSLTSSCSSVKKIAVETDVNRLLNRSEIFSNQFTGFSLLDLETNQVIAGHNATLKFTPASNTKLLTMYATLKSFQDSIPSLLIRKIDSGVYVKPIGDPSFLYSPFTSQPIIDYLNKNDHVFISWPETTLEPYGPGWAWDDYVYSFQSQRSWWPIYGNAVQIVKSTDSLTIVPSFFEEDVEIVEANTKKSVERDRTYNLFRIRIESDTSSIDKMIPFEYSKELLIKLLQDTLSANIGFTSQKLSTTDTLYSQHVDTVLSYMLKPSDNFMAEQLLIQSAWKNGFQDIDSYIKYLKSTDLASLTEMVWVDGSGLSRYNLISPIDQVRLLKLCYDEFGWERITHMLPTGGEGTLEDRFLAEEPYIFAKTGTLSNNHNLSGFLITKSGKRMIFSFMSNHYTRPTDEIKRAMEAFLLELRNSY